MQWASFEYRDFWDVPRLIVVRFPRGILLLQSLFNDTTEDYDADYTVSRLPVDIDLTGSWVSLAEAAIERLGTIPVRDVVFDPTRRQQLDLDGIRRLLPTDLLHT